MRATYKNGHLHFVGQMPAGESDNVIVTFLEEPELHRTKTAREFLEKWAGFLKGVEVCDPREARYDALKRKHA